MTLALLLTSVGGAWAQTETLLTTITATGTEQASYSTANMATVSFSTTAQGSSQYLANWGWWGYGWIATVTAAEGYTITKCIFYDDANRTATDSEAPFVVETTEEDKTPRINGTPIDGGNMWSKGIKKIDVYGYVTPTAPTTPTAPSDINLHRNDDGSWSFIMPARNLVVNAVLYSGNDPNGYTIAGVPEGWQVLVLGEPVTITDGVTTPITEGAPVTIVPTGNLRRIKSITLVDELPPAIPLDNTITAQLAAKLAYTGGEIADFTDATDNLTTMTWAVGEHIAILYEVSGTKKVADAEITAVDGTTGEATITFTVEDGTPNNTPCTLVYPYDAAKDDHTGVKDAATLLAAQDGTLSANLDVRVGAGTIQTTTPGLTVTTQPAAQFAIFKFTTKNANGSATIDVTKLTITIGAQNYVITPALATSELYVALPAVADQAVRFSATGSDSKTYTCSKASVTFAAGKYYQSTLKMAPPITVTWNNNDITGSGNSFSKDGVTITAGSIDFYDKNFEENGTFTTTLGNFTKIEVVVTNGFCDVSGTGWSGNSDKRTWTGNASSVSFIGDIYGDGNGIKFVFTIEP